MPWFELVEEITKSLASHVSLQLIEVCIQGSLAQLYIYSWNGEIKEQTYCEFNPACH
jgi:hypothetical protein